MQGTMHVRSLIRLFVGAVLLCLAWLLLTSGPASATERPAPTQPASDLVRSLPVVGAKGLEGVIGVLVGKPEAQAQRPADPAPRTTTRGTPPKAKRAQKPSAATSSDSARAPRKLVATGPVDEVVRRVTPVLQRVDAATLAPVDAGLELVTDVTDVAARLPLAGQPVDHLADAVAGLVRTVPVVGLPAPIVPLPIGAGTPTDVVVVPVVVVPVPAVVETRPTAPRALLRAAAGSLVTPRVGSAPVADTGPSHAGSSMRSVAQAASDGRRPSPPGALIDPAPALPSQPSPTGGAGQGAGDLATVSAVLGLLNPSLFGRSGADWRVPRGLPAHPGTRPD
jgi:hypothetical protein